MNFPKRVQIIIIIIYYYYCCCYYWQIFVLIIQIFVKIIELKLFKINI